MSDDKTPAAGYNSCFVLGGKCRQEEGKTVKSPVYIKKDGIPAKLYRRKDGKTDWLYNLPYQRAVRMLKNYQENGKPSDDISDIRVSVYLDNAMYNDLHVFVIDFDGFDGRSAFFLGAKALADKVTRSQGGGYHMFYGIDKTTATPLFNSINLLASRHAKSYICHTGATTLDGKNKVDFFCDSKRLIYEWETWDNTAGLTDCTAALHQLIREHFALNRPKGSPAPEVLDADGNPVRQPHLLEQLYEPELPEQTDAPELLEQLDGPELLERMSDAQKKIFENLRTISSDDCGREKWVSVGLDLWNVFGSELGGKVFRFWSAPGHSFNPQGCAQTWDYICRQGPDSKLIRSGWRALLREEKLLEQMSGAQKTIFKELNTSLPDCGSKAHFSMGLNIWHVFGSELGGEVFRFWSERGQNFDSHKCGCKWKRICERGPGSTLNKRNWRDLLEHEARRTP